MLFCGIYWIASLLELCNPDDGCLNILFQAWYLVYDGALAGKKSSALMLIQEIGPMLDLQVNIEKCEFSADKVALRIKGLKHATFWHAIDVPNGEYLFCANFIASKMP